jgi:hypothetical protein
MEGQKGIKSKTFFQFTQIKNKKILSNTITKTKNEQKSCEIQNEFIVFLNPICYIN